MDSVPAEPETVNQPASAMATEPTTPAPEPVEPEPMDGIEIAAISPANEAAAAGPDRSSRHEPRGHRHRHQVPAEAGPLPLREAADAGDAKALFEVASRYAEGRGGLRHGEAAKWYEKSAELGFAPAQYRIGNFYEKGIGVDARSRERQRPGISAPPNRATPARCTISPCCLRWARTGRPTTKPRPAGSSTPPNSA